jgi:hypothetical protein
VKPPGKVTVIGVLEVYVAEVLILREISFSTGRLTSSTIVAAGKLAELTS